ncbi:oligosaccharide flippase family protein [Levilactobacillus brevis]|uniref:oligosaccharide flippase family protein n=1 Tax=Levilactobacillus brevis TaxID=1580 RepID=UPI00345E06D5
MNNTKVYKNVIWNLGLQFITLALPLIIIPYVSRVLGPTGVGINAFTSSTAQYFVLLANLGISIYGSKEVAVHRSNKKELSVVFWQIFFIKFIASIISILIFSIIIFQSTKYRSYYIVQYLMIMAVLVDITWFFQGIEQFRKTVLRNVFTRLLVAALTFLFVKDVHGTYLYVLFTALSNFIANIALWFGIKNYISFNFDHIFDVKKLWKMFKESLSLFIPQVAAQIYLPLNKSLLGLMLGITSAGYFDNCDKIVKVVVGLITSIGTVLLPHISHFKAEGKDDKIIISLINILYIILYAGCFLTAIIIALAPPFSLWFFGNKFKEVGLLMQMEAPVIFFIAISNAIGYQYLIPTNSVGVYSRSVTFGALLNIIIDLPLILILHVQGAIIATVISEAFVVVIQILVVRNILPIGSILKELCKYIVCAIVLIITAHLCTYLRLGVGFSYLIVTGLLSTCSYLIVTLLLRPSGLFKGISYLRTL